jgi:regulation of enolase protein 1 (concanavalin A-like superfamily)
VAATAIVGLVADRLMGVPFPFEPSGPWRVDATTGAVRVSAPPRTDIFVDPADGTTVLNAVTLVGSAPAGDYQFSVRVSVEFAATYDAGVLLLWSDEHRWAKLCFEFSPAGDPMVVSVVCRGVADDANAFVVGQRHAWLRVSRLGPAYAFHASVDGHVWQLIRYFSLDDAPRAQIGFEAQSPTGDGCDVSFDEIRFVPARLAELRDGS